MAGKVTDEEKETLEMKERLTTRLQELRKEFESGQKMLSELEAKQANVRSTLLRISGAIQVLEEELNANGTGETAEELIKSSEKITASATL